MKKRQAKKNIRTRLRKSKEAAILLSETYDKFSDKITANFIKEWNTPSLVSVVMGNVA